MKMIAITLLLVLTISCDTNNQKLLLVNNTDNEIFYRLKLDTNLYSELYLYECNQHDSIYPNFVKGSGKTAWECKIYSKSIDSSLYIFIFETNKINEEIIQNGVYERKGFTVNKLNEKNWIIAYPEDFE